MASSTQRAPFLCALERAGLMTDEVGKIVAQCSKKTVFNKKVASYDENLFGILEEAVRQFRVHVMFLDFEVYLIVHGCQELINEAEQAYGRNKILQSRYVAELIPYVPRRLRPI